MIQGGTREALAVEDLILRVAAVVAAVGVATAAVLVAAEAGAQRLNLRVGRLQNLHQDLLAPALSQEHHLQEGMFRFLYHVDAMLDFNGYHLNIV